MNKLDIPYSMGGMAQYYKSLTELIEYRLSPDITKVVVNTSVQPNSIPHFGTLTTCFCAFIYAKKISDAFSIETSVELDLIECGPSSHYHQAGGETCFSIARTPAPEDSSKSIADFYISNYYIPLLTWCHKISGVSFTTRKYEEFQRIPTVRSVIIAICNDIQFFESLLCPKSKKLHIRPECPNCGSIDKHLKQVVLKNIHAGGFTVSSHCSNHGSYSVNINNSAQNYIEINTQLRDIAKGALMASYLDEGILGIMFDGGDWGGAWTHHIHCESLNRLGYQLPIRLFSPLILDWSGGKLSKSIYLRGISQSSCLTDYQTFMGRYGDNGLLCIYNEVENWISDPKKFFRNYSEEYILEVLRQNSRVDSNA